MNRRGSGYGGARREIRGGIGAGGVDLDAAFLAEMSAAGGTLHHWWETRSGLITFNGSNIARNHDVRETNFVTPTLAYLDQATAASQPAWVNDGSGPNSVAYANLQDTARNLAATVSFGANHRTGIYAVVKHGTNAAADRYTMALTTAVAPVVIDYSRNAASPQGLKLFADFNAGTDINGRIDDYNGSWLLWALRPLQTGAVTQINGANTANQPSNTNGLVAATKYSLGYALGAASDGAVAAIILTSEPTAAVDTAIKNYVAARFGLTLS